MNGKDLALELSSWLDIDTVLTVGRRHERDLDVCMERDSIVLAHPQLGSGSDGDIAGLVRLYLEHFSVPAAWLSTVRSMAGPSLLERDTWDWLEGLRFEGEIEVDADVERLEVPVAKAQVLIDERWAVTEILMRPLQALFGSALVCFESWRRVLEAVPPESLFLKTRGDGALAAFIDCWVAEASKIPHPGLGGRRQTAVNAGYRRVTALATFEELRSTPLREAAAESLSAMAAELRR